MPRMVGLNKSFNGQLFTGQGRPNSTRNYEKLTGHLNAVKILNLQKHLQSANILYN